MRNLKYLVAFFSFVASFSAWGQGWYEIEVLIFEHTSNPYENLSDPERWPSNIDLAWPSPLMELDPAAELTGETEQNGETDSQGNLLPEPYAELPSDQRRLSNANYAMRVRDGYQLLWHKSWKAPLLPEESAPWILIQADQQIDDHYRLEGGIRIHLARYLHLHSDLWLTELLPVGSEEQTEFHWSQLPKPVLTQWPCIFVEESWPDSERGLPEDYNEKPAPGEWYYPFGCGIDTEDREEGEEEQDFPIALPLAPSESLNILSAAREFAIQADTDNDTNQQTLENTKPDLSGAQIFGNRNTQQAPILTSEAEGSVEESANERLAEGYPVKEIIHIQSQRRMRSEELHYVDHPKIGILTIIHPVDQPVLEAKPIQYISAPLPGPSITESSTSTTE